MLPSRNNKKEFLHNLNKRTQGLIKAPCFYLSVFSIILLTFISLGAGLLSKVFTIKNDLYLANVSKVAALSEESEADLLLEPIKDKELSPESPQFILIKNAVLLAATPPTTFSSQVLGSLVAGYQNEESKSVITEYLVEEGDTLSTLSEEFNISLNTILWANNLTAKSVIKPGQKLVILPVSGTVHIISSGETISKIAQTYKAKEAEIVNFNELASKDDIFVGDVLVIPNGQMPAASTPSKSTTPTTTSGSNKFIAPVHSPYIITQGAHGYYQNAVDFSHAGYACGKPVIAAAAGVVQKTGYDAVAGNYVRILHNNGIVTFYGHLSKILVSSGKQVSIGERIGLIGNTGYTKGVTGCHLHFEVRGAANPFAK